MTRCEACPAPEGWVCYRWLTGHARFCEWAAMGGAHREVVRENSSPDGEPILPTVVPRSAKPRISLGVSQHSHRR